MMLFIMMSFYIIIIIICLLLDEGNFLPDNADKPKPQNDNPPKAQTKAKVVTTKPTTGKISCVQKAS